MHTADPFVDAFAPQVYWFWYPNKKMFSEPGAKGPYKTNDASAYANLCLDVWRHITDKPIVITGQAYWGESHGWERQDAEEKLQEFVTGFDRYGEIAGLNWWHLAGNAAMSSAMEALIAAADFQAKLDAAPVAKEAAPAAAVPPMLQRRSSTAHRHLSAFRYGFSVGHRHASHHRGRKSLRHRATRLEAAWAGLHRLHVRHGCVLRGSLCPVAGPRSSRGPNVARTGTAFRDTHGHLKGDALTWYNDQFKAISMGAATPVERLRRLFVLLLGLGMRESSGRYCEGRDRSANNTGADTAEAGLFQMSFDLVAPRAELLDVFHHYQSNPGEGLREIFEVEMSPPPRPKDRNRPLAAALCAGE